MKNTHTAEQIALKLLSYKNILSTMSGTLRYFKAEHSLFAHFKDEEFTVVYTLTLDKLHIRAIHTSSDTKVGLYEIPIPYKRTLTEEILLLMEQFTDEEVKVFIDFNTLSPTPNEEKEVNMANPIENFNLLLAQFVERQLKSILTLPTKPLYRRIAWHLKTLTLSLKIGYRDGDYILLSMNESGIKAVHLDKDIPVQIGELDTNTAIGSWMAILSGHESFTFGYMPEDIE